MIIKYIKKYIPDNLKNRLRYLLMYRKVSKAKRRFRKASNKPEWLDQSDFDYLMKKYPIKQMQSYDPESLKSRAESRLKHIFSFVPEHKVQTILELGCFDGMVSAELQSVGKMATGIDIRDWVDSRAKKSGAQFFNMDASNMTFEDESFDCIISYDSFEHFSNPDLVMKEAYRVLKKGGYMFLSFGNCHYSMKALHVNDIINIPYCHLLFTKELINNYAQSNNLRKIDYDFINGWDNGQFERLWKQYAGNLKMLNYKEFLNIQGLEVITDYPSCFKSKTQNFDDLIVNNFEILFLKIK